MALTPVEQMDYVQSQSWRDPAQRRSLTRLSVELHNERMTARRLSNELDEQIHWPDVLRRRLEEERVWRTAVRQVGREAVDDVSKSMQSLVYGTPPTRQDAGPSTGETSVTTASTRIIRVVAETLLLDPVGLPYGEILRRILAEFPEASTTSNCLRWYAAKMKERGETMPDQRARTPRRRRRQ